MIESRSVCAIRLAVPEGQLMCTALCPHPNGDGNGGGCWEGGSSGSGGSGLGIGPDPGSGSCNQTFQAAMEPPPPLLSLALLLQF